MGSVSSPGGPSIAGYNSSMIAADITIGLTVYNTLTGTLTNASADYNTKKTDAFTALSTYLSAKTAYNLNQDQAHLDAMNAAFATYQSKYDLLDAAGTALASASGGALQAATEYITALARSQMFQEQSTHDSVNDTVTALISDIAAQPFSDGLTQQRLNDLQIANNARTSTRFDLLDAFNAYRYLDSQIATLRNLRTGLGIQRDLANLSGQISGDMTAFNQLDTQYNTLDASINTEISNRTSKSTALQTALSNYASALTALDTTLTSVTTAANLQASGWPAVLAAAQSDVNTITQNILNATILSDTNIQAAHYAAWPETQPSFISDQLGGVQSVLTGESFGNLNFGVTNIPSLPQPHANMTMAEIMRLISSVQLMVNQLSRLIADADSNSNVLRKTVSANTLSLLIQTQQAANLWAQQVTSADSVYNDQVAFENQVRYNLIKSQYDLINSNLTQINTAIDQVNAQINATNNKQLDLTNQLNLLRGTIAVGINAANISPPDARNYFDLYNEDPNLSPPTPQTPILAFQGVTISLFNHLTSIPPAPVANFEGQPPVTPSQAELDAFNANIQALNESLSSLKTFPEIATILGNSPINYLTLRSLIPVRNPQIIVNNTQVVTTLIPEIAIMLTSMSVADFYNNLDGTQTGAEIVALIKGKRTAQGGLTRALGTITPTSLGGGSGLATSDINAPGSLISNIITQLAANGTLKTELKRILDRIAITAGLKASVQLGTEQSIGSILGLTPEDLGALEGKDAATNNAILVALTQELLAASGNDGQILASAQEILKSLTGLEKVSKEDIEELLTMIALLQKLVYLLLAAVTGVTSGLPVDKIPEHLSGKVENLAKGFEKLGVDTKTSQLLAETLSASQIRSAYSLVPSGLSQKNAIAVTFLAASTGAGLDPAQLVPGGRAQIDLLLQDLNKEGVTFTANPGTSEFARQIQNVLNSRPVNKSSTQVPLVSTPPVGTPPVGTPLVGTPPVGTPPVGTPPVGTPPTETPPTDFSNIPDISAVQILGRLQADFARLPPDVQKKLIAQATADFGIPGISDAQLTALLTGTTTGALTLPQAQTLLALAQAELGLAQTGTEIIKKLFETPPQILEQIKDEIKKQGITRDIMRQFIKAYKDIQLLTGNDPVIVDKITSFTNTIKKLSDFNTVFLNFLIDPAKLMVREFSIITRTDTDKRNQPKILLGG